MIGLKIRVLILGLGFGVTDGRTFGDGDLALNEQIVYIIHPPHIHRIASYSIFS